MLVHLYQPAVLDNSLVVTVMLIVQHRGSADCGLSAIGTAFQAASGLSCDLKQEELRQHLKENFDTEILTPSSPDTEEQTYRLSVVDQDSKAAMTAVSLNIDPSESTGGQQSGADATPMFDSERMPVVKLK